MTIAYDTARVRADFPILSRVHHADVPLVYLDNAATSQKPQAVLDAVDHFYRHDNANVHRGLHLLSEAATEAYESARRKVAGFINARSWREIVFTRGTTESINLVAQAWARTHLRPGDIILSTVMEHHANIVPWQMVTAATSAEVHYIPLEPDGALDLDAVKQALDAGRVRLLTVTHASNVLGTVNPIRKLAQMAHAAGAFILVDGAQAVAHQPVDVAALDVDFYAFSGHKMCAPTGIGVLYGRREILEAMPPWMGGGDMIEQVTLAGSTYAAPPNRFEAGTPPIAGAVGLGAAVDYLTGIGMEAVHARVSELTAYTLAWLADIPGVQVIGRAPHRAPVVAFTVKGLHAHDTAQMLDLSGIAVRAGHHCAMPLHTDLGLPATVRASLALYTSRAEIDTFARALRDIAHVHA
ncbi:MAG: cysteine desulfurase [Anaerolineae bacterium]|jgi:cysteine desulfurase/selenocysteine lyase|nr:cysteine desulfurase [Anaerolineae bacterium]